MVAALIIVFREVLEAALILGIVLAATRGVPGVRRWIGSGVVAGIVGSGVLAAFASTLAEALSGYGQEVFNAAVLLVAVAMLAWHNIWMSRHGREMARDISAMGAAVTEGRQPLHMLAVVVGLAVLREGSETALFLYGLTVSAPGDLPAQLAGSALGVLAGAGVGALLYLGLLTVSSRHLFAVTSWMITLLAAGLATQAVTYLNAADLLTVLAEPLWDSSALLAENSVIGQIAHTLVGYTDRPSGMQLLVYLFTLGAIVGAGRLARLPAPRPAPAG